MNEELESSYRTQISRRVIVGTGAKMAYTVPLVAASFALNERGVLASVCPPGYTRIDDAEPGSECCACDCTTADAILDPVTVTCISPKFGDVTDICLTCVGTVVSAP